LNTVKIIIAPEDKSQWCKWIAYLPKGIKRDLSLLGSPTVLLPKYLVSRKPTDQVIKDRYPRTMPVANNTTRVIFLFTIKCIIEKNHPEINKWFSRLLTY